MLPQALLNFSLFFVDLRPNLLLRLVSFLWFCFCLVFKAQSCSCDDLWVAWCITGYLAVVVCRSFCAPLRRHITNSNQFVQHLSFSYAQPLKICNINFNRIVYGRRRMQGHGEGNWADGRRGVWLALAVGEGVGCKWCAVSFLSLVFFASSFALPLPAGLCCVSCMHKCHVILSGEWNWSWLEKRTRNILKYCRKNGG